MLTVEEIKRFIEEDDSSEKKQLAKVGRRYFNGDNDIKNYRVFYYNADGNLVEDKTRSNIKIAHNFHRELCIQVSQYILSGNDGIVKSNIPELQSILDERFNDNDDYISELSETITMCAAEGSSYMYAYINEKNETAFQYAGYTNVVEVREKDTDDGCKYFIYSYTDRINKGKEKIVRIQVHDDKQIYFYVQDGDGKIEIDSSETINPKPKVLYNKKGKNGLYYKNNAFRSFFRIDNNREQRTDLVHYKDQVDDYDIHASALTNNLVDFDTPVHVVKGFQGDNLDELQQNLKTKKIIGVDENGGVEVHTVDVPYQARLAKLELNEKSIYRCGMGLNMQGLKDTNATTNIAIKASYSLLDMKAKELEKRIKPFVKQHIKLVLDEINGIHSTDYQMKDVWVEFKHEIMTNELENAQKSLVEAQEQQTRVGTLLNAAPQLDVETVQQKICETLELEWEKIKDKLPDPNEAKNEIDSAETVLNSIEETA